MARNGTTKFLKITKLIENVRKNSNKCQNSKKFETLKTQKNYKRCLKENFFKNEIISKNPKNLKKSKNPKNLKNLKILKILKIKLLKFPKFEKVPKKVL